MSVRCADRVTIVKGTSRRTSRALGNDRGKLALEREPARGRRSIATGVAAPFARAGRSCAIRALAPPTCGSLPPCHPAERRAPEPHWTSGARLTTPRRRDEADVSPRTRSRSSPRQPPAPRPPTAATSLDAPHADAEDCAASQAEPRRYATTTVGQTPLKGTPPRRSWITARGLTAAARAERSCIPDRHLFGQCRRPRPPSGIGTSRALGNRRRAGPCRGRGRKAGSGPAASVASVLASAVPCERQQGGEAASWSGLLLTESRTSTARACLVVAFWNWLNHPADEGAIHDPRSSTRTAPHRTGVRHLSHHIPDSPVAIATSSRRLLSCGRQPGVQRRSANAASPGTARALGNSARSSIPAGAGQAGGSDSFGASQLGKQARPTS